MAATTERTALPEIRHEHWCRPTGERTQIRVEQFIAYRDMPTGRSDPAMRVTRCLECGEATYTDL